MRLRGEALGRVGQWVRPSSDAQGLREYLRWSQYLLTAGLTVVPVLTSIAAGIGPWVGVSIAFGAVFAALGILNVRAAHDAVVMGPALPTGASKLPDKLLAALTAVTAGWAIFALTVVATAAGARESEPALAISAQTVMWIATIFTSVLASRVRLRPLIPIALVCCALVAWAQLRSPGSGNWLPATVAALAYTIGIAALIRGEMWFLAVLVRLDDARETATRLAVAEERLRFSRDLHDVVGQALSAIAIKSEIAAELLRRGDDRAAGVMAEVRQLAQSSLGEARAVVSGYRRSDLVSEIAGARSLLAAAGVATTIVGSPTTVPTHLQEPFGWVAREAVTNLLRHSDASRCLIAVEAQPAAVSLRITNDGATSPAMQTRDGVGLAGLRERLAAVGGTLTTRRDGADFEIAARAPTREQVP